MYDIVHYCTYIYNGMRSMQHIMADIIASTRGRVRNIKEINTAHTLTTRSIEKSIQAAKNKHNIPVIAEVKPASPTIQNRDVIPEDAAVIARTMEEAGASAISVLTEPAFFKGSLENLKYVYEAVHIPVLRKDFIVDKRQLYEAQSDLILLIAGILDDQLHELITLAMDRGLQPLVEVHNEDELKIVLDSDAKIIGINNRNLKTMEIDLSTTEILAPVIKEQDANRIIISESGISTPDDAVRVMQAGADAILVGTYIMKGDIYKNTKNLVEAGSSIL